MGESHDFSRGSMSICCLCSCCIALRGGGGGIGAWYFWDDIMGTAEEEATGIDTCNGTDTGEEEGTAENGTTDTGTAENGTGVATSNKKQ